MNLKNAFNDQNKSDILIYSTNIDKRKWKKHSELVEILENCDKDERSNNIEEVSDEHSSFLYEDNDDSDTTKCKYLQYISNFF